MESELPLQGKNIVVLLGALVMGGAERQALLLARHLKQEQKANVEVWGFSHPGLVAQICDEWGIPWREVAWPWARNPYKRWKKLRAITDQLRDFNVDILMPYTTMPSIFGGLIWRRAGAKMCVWNLRDEGRDIHGRWLSQRISIQRASHVVANSRHAAQLLEKTFNLPRPVNVILNGVELAPAQMSREQWREKLGIDEKHLLACMVANLHKFKDQLTLIEAWAQVQQNIQPTGQKATLLIAGMPIDDTAEKARILVDELGIENNIQFLDGVADIPGLLRAIDIGVFSSFFEGCPNGVLECMAAGLPMAATDIPGIREAVGDEGAAWLAPPGDAPKMAELITQLCNDASLRAQLGEANLQRVSTAFSPERMCNEYVKLLTSGLARSL